MFSRYHYLNHELSKSADVYIGLIDKRLVSFMGVLHFPHPKNKQLKRVTRLVVLPDYQGLGVGYYMLCAIGELYKRSDQTLTIVSSNRALYFTLINSRRWSLIRNFSRVAPQGKSSGFSGDSINSCQRYTASFKYSGLEEINEDQS